MSDRQRILTEQVVVRVTPTMRAAIEADALANGRTPAQSVRFHLEQWFANAGELERLLAEDAQIEADERRRGMRSIAAAGSLSDNPNPPED